MPRPPSVALLTRRMLEHRVWQAAQYEFEDVITDLADVRLVAPTPRTSGRAGRIGRRLGNQALVRVGRPARADARRPDGSSEVDLFVGVFGNPYELSSLPLVREQLERSARKVAFIVELYAPGLEKIRSYLPALRGFDHIFVFSRAVLAPLEAATGVPTSFLPTGVDALRFTPSARAPERTIDVTSFGRRHETTHSTLLAALLEQGIHYQFDTARRSFEVTGHADHRINLAATLQRSRYSIVYKINDDADRLSLTGGEETLTSRYYEATAAGAVVLGSSPSTPDFTDQFPWSDSVVPVRCDGSDVLEVMAELDRDPDRVEQARRAGIEAALTRHDWSYRWERIVTAVGLPVGPRVDLRKAVLADRATQLRAAGDVTGSPRGRMA